jgi:hypothetical protein
MALEAQREPERPVALHTEGLGSRDVSLTELNPPRLANALESQVALPGVTKASADLFDELRELSRRVKDWEGRHQHSITTQADRVSRLAADTEVSLRSLQDQMVQTTRWMVTTNSLATNVTNVEQVVAELVERVGGHERQMLAVLTDTPGVDDDAITELHQRIDSNETQLKHLSESVGAPALSAETETSLRKAVDDVARQIGEHATRMARIERRLAEQSSLAVEMITAATLESTVATLKTSFASLEATVKDLVIDTQVGLSDLQSRTETNEEQVRTCLEFRDDATQDKNQTDSTELHCAIFDLHNRLRVTETLVSEVQRNPVVDAAALRRDIDGVNRVVLEQEIRTNTLQKLMEEIAAFLSQLESSNLLTSTAKADREASEKCRATVTLAERDLKAVMSRVDRIESQLFRETVHLSGDSGALALTSKAQLEEMAALQRLSRRAASHVDLPSSSSSLVSRLGSLSFVPAESEIPIEPPVNDFQALRRLVGEIHTKLNPDDPTPTLRVDATGDDWKLTSADRELNAASVSPTADSPQASLRVPTVPRMQHSRALGSGGVEKKLADMSMVKDTLALLGESEKVRPISSLQSHQQLQHHRQSHSPRDQSLVPTTLRKLDASVSSVHDIQEPHSACSDAHRARNSGPVSPSVRIPGTHSLPHTPTRTGSPPARLDVTSQLARDMNMLTVDRSASHLGHNVRYQSAGDLKRCTSTVSTTGKSRPQSYAFPLARSQVSTCPARRCK